MSLSEEELAAIRADAHTVAHNTDAKAWAWRCAVCKEAVEMIKAEVDCDEPTAKLLYAGWLMENAGTLHRDAVFAWRETMDRNYPIAKRMTDAAEEQLRQMKEGDDWKPGDVSG